MKNLFSRAVVVICIGTYLTACATYETKEELAVLPASEVPKTLKIGDRIQIIPRMGKREDLVVASVEATSFSATDGQTFTYGKWDVLYRYEMVTRKKSDGAGVYILEGIGVVLLFPFFLICRASNSCDMR